MARAQVLGQALLGRALLGVGMSCNLMGAMTLLAAWFPPAQFATMSGLLVGIGYLGTLLAATHLALPLAERLFDRWLGSRKRVVAPGLFLSALLTLGLGLLSRDGANWLVYPLLTLIGAAAPPGQIVYAHVKELVPAGRQGAAMTGVNFFTMLGLAVVMQLVGLTLAGRGVLSAARQPSRGKGLGGDRSTQCKAMRSPLRGRSQAHLEPKL